MSLVVNYGITHRVHRNDKPLVLSLQSVIQIIAECYSMKMRRINRYDSMKDKATI